MRRGPRSQRTLTTIVAAAALLFSAACGTGVGAPPGAAEPVPASDAVKLASGHRQAAAAAPGHRHAAAVVRQAPLQPAGLRIRLEELLGHHSTLTDRLSRAALRGDVDFAQSADAALVKNTEELGSLIASVYGNEAARGFEDLWASHVRYLATYTDGLRDGDSATMRGARRDLDRYARDLSRFLAQATNGAAPAGVVRAGLNAHVHHLLAQARAYAGERYKRAYSIGRTGYRHTFELGKQLAGAIATRDGDALPAGFDSRGRELQSALGLLLGEHVELAVDAMRAGVQNLPDFPAAADALNSNSRDLAAAVESVFTPRAGERFLALWSDHIDAFVSYTQGLAAGEDEAREDARDRLAEFNDAFAKFLRSATGKRVSTRDLLAAFTDHEEVLLRQINAYADEKYAEAHNATFSAYHHMFGLAKGLAGAIGAAVAARSPRGGAQTGGAGAAPADVPATRRG